MSEDPPVADLGTRARNGDKQAWDALVERYAPLVWSVCRRHRLSDADADEVGQAVWLQLVGQLGTVRDRKVAGWLVSTTERECSRVRRAARGPQAPERALDAGRSPGPQTGLAEQELLLAERHATLREAFGRLPSHCQRLIAMLAEDPPVRYAQIGASLGVPADGIGPRRSRCLDRLRQDPAIAALIDAEARSGREPDPALFEPGAGPRWGA